MLIQRSPAAVAPVRLTFGDPPLSIDLSQSQLRSIAEGKDVLDAKGETQGRPVRLRIDVERVADGKVSLTLNDSTAWATLGVAVLDPLGLVASDDLQALDGLFDQRPEWRFAGSTKEYARGKNNALKTTTKGDPSTEMGRHHMVAGAGLNPQDGWFPEARHNGWNFARYMLNGRPVR